jgi:hypothetical protein
LPAPSKRRIATILPDFAGAVCGSASHFALLTPIGACRMHNNCQICVFSQKQEFWGKDAGLVAQSF